MTIFQIYVIAAIAIALIVGAYLINVAIAKSKQGKPPVKKTQSAKPTQKSETQSDEPGSAWWVEVITADPPCTYYFGPFESTAEAEQAKPGYVEDLSTEGALEILAEVKWCAPKELTRTEDNKQPISAS